VTILVNLDLDELRNLAASPCPHDASPTTCSACAAEAKGGSPEGARRWRAIRATADCDRRIPRRYVNAVADHPQVLAWIGQYTADPDQAPSLLIAGPTGVGKTWQAYGALRAVTIATGRTWQATTYADLIASLRPGSGSDPEGALRAYRTAGLLLVDDLGAAKTSEWVEETTYRLINGRYEDMLPSIFTTNLPLADLRAGLGDRIASRLVEMCTRVALTGPDRRRQPRPTPA
jgi:DNA replication protein